MGPLLINEDRIIWLALIGSLLIHSLLLVFSGTTFIQRAQYSVEPSARAVEVSIQEIKDPEDTLQTEDRSIKSLEKIIKASKKKNKGRQAVRSISGVRLKANPDYFQNPPPEYPELAKQMRQEGLVLLSVDVDKTGEPLKVEIIQSCGFRLLDQAALKAVSHWKFQPGSIGHIPVESTVTVPIRFRLEK